MKFNVVAQVFENIEKISSRTAITQSLADLFAQATPREVNIVCNLSLGQLYPPYQNKHFAIADKMMIRVVSQVLSEVVDIVTALVKKEGDIGAVIAAGNWQHDRDISIEDVYDTLDEIARVRGEGSQEKKILLLEALLKSLDPLSAKFVVRIILGILRLGFSDMTLIDALSWMAVGDKSARSAIEDAYNVCADLGLIGQTIAQDGVGGIEHMRVHVGIPIRPAAAERLPKAADVIKKIGPCVAQPKIDGFRVQVHIKKHDDAVEIHCFSRNLLDISDTFPELNAALRQLPVKDMIAEGEAIAYDPNTETFVRFQETVKRKRKHEVETVAAALPLKLFLFDLLSLNGQSVMDLSHEERRQQLVAIFKDSKQSVVQPIEERYCATAEDLEHYFEFEIEHGLEGLVAKRPDAIYQPGRRNFNWIKLKRVQEGHLEDTIDTVILGYYAGEGKRAQFGIGAILVGVYNKQLDRFETIAKVGTGFTDSGFRELKKKCDEHVVKGKPHNVDCPPSLIPDMWVAPEIAIALYADEITISPVHTAGKTATHEGYALRFPRFIDYRPDKAATDVTTVSEIERLYANQKVHKKH